MKIAVTGKGGVGKTTFAALLARRLALNGRNVLAVDADPDANLAAALDFPDPDSITPIVEMKQLIAERMGTDPDSPSPYFKMNPRVDDLPLMFRVEHDNIRLIVMGKVKRGGAGCACPEHTFLKSLLAEIILGPDEDVLVDMEAGLEHLGRGTASAVDGLFVVVEPGMRSVETLTRIRELADDLDISRIWPIANRVSSPNDKDFFEDKLGGEAVGFIPYSEKIALAGRGSASLMDVEQEIWTVMDSILEKCSVELSA